MAGGGWHDLRSWDGVLSVLGVSWLCLMWHGRPPLRRRSLPRCRVRSPLAISSTACLSAPRNFLKQHRYQWVEQLNLACPWFLWYFRLLAQTVLLTGQERICWAEFISYGPNIDILILCLPLLRQYKNRAKTFIIPFLFYWRYARAKVASCGKV